MTLAEVGAVMGVTRERVRQIEVKALRKLRKNPDAIRMREMLIEERNFTDTVPSRDLHDALPHLFSAIDKVERRYRRSLPAQRLNRAQRARAGA